MSHTPVPADKQRIWNGVAHWVSVAILGIITLFVFRAEGLVFQWLFSLQPANRNEVLAKRGGEFVFYFLVAVVGLGYTWFKTIQEMTQFYKNSDDGAVESKTKPVEPAQK